MSRKGNIRTMSISTFICADCGSEIPLPRNKQLKRDKNHVKDVFCVKCKKVTHHYELRGEDFIGDPNIKIPQKVLDKIKLHSKHNDSGVDING